jgi:hypothetical protein
MRSDTQKIQILTLVAADKSYTCYVPVQISTTNVMSCNPQDLFVAVNTTSSSGAIVEKQQPCHSLLPGAPANANFGVSLGALPE